MLFAQAGAEHSIPSVPLPTAGSSSHKTLPSGSGSGSGSGGLVFGLGASITNTDGVTTLAREDVVLQCMKGNRGATFGAFDAIQGEAATGA
ncbi:hypothetical protein AAFF_G00393450 [Aldrovandia affinis]|uniref:Uncharacterized protein n=1 Tax=Aldrovandia affinis TaxID=143900 RepID=A0AAD7SDG7_9TELE|nr:hypothetical protein AAFF_G00393450 [Aldrovandia affinis]